MHPNTRYDVPTVGAVSILWVVILWDWSKLRRSRTIPA